MQGTQATGTSTAVTLSIVEAALLIVVGILATRTSEWWAWIGLVFIVGLLLVIRWFLAAPLRRAEALSRLDAYFSDRSELHSSLRAIACHMAESKPLWDFWELHSGVKWWFEDDLVTEWFTEQDFERSRRKGKQGLWVRSQLRKPKPIRSLRRTFWSVRRAIEHGVLKSPALIDAVNIVGFEDVARKLLSRAKEEGFVVEQVVADQGDHALGTFRILHAWKIPDM